jgi:cytoskeletal protein RodZ
MTDEYEDELPRSRQKISFLRRWILELRFLSKTQLTIFIVAILFILCMIIFIVHEYTAASQNNNPPSVSPSPAPSNTPSNAPSPSPINTNTSTNNDSSSSDNQTVNPNVSPTVDCVGPDGKHFYTTQQQCNSFNAAWATPTPTAAPTTPTPSPTPTSTAPTDTPTPTP